MAVCQSFDPTLQVQYNKAIKRRWINVREQQKSLHNNVGHDET
jgi:hypothetical protein